MNKASLHYCILLAVSFVVFFSCKKTHSLNPTPANNRLLNVTLKNVVTDTNSATVMAVDENYRFTYDNYGRVSKVYFSTNDISKSNTISTYTYSGDTIFDRITFVTNALIELDTFITDLHGHITRTYIQGNVTEYFYYNDLLSRILYPDGTSEEMRSYNGDIISTKNSIADKYNSTFTYYTDMHNRIGDYFYLRNMFRYGNDLFRNSNLVRSIKVPDGTIDLTYVIDGDSKVTRTTAVVADTFHLTHNEVYDIQYEKY